jgi:hypothetical protein
LTDGLDIVEAIRDRQNPLYSLLFLSLLGPLLYLLRRRPYPYYSLLPDGAAVPPSGQVRVLRELVPEILRSRGISASIQAEARRLTTHQLIDALQNPNQVVLFTYFVEPGNLMSGHTIVLVAYDPEKGFGFLNSGCERPNPDDLPKSQRGDPKELLTWKKAEKMERLLDHWTNVLIRPQFVIITR